ncbi:carbohydrate ABC transporter permease [Mahella australiensis]|uniref:Binding-protein-dependent transport systems inner membrane component n=1 Tax=Mahella australiensis (strain DSM 15567 / CIP 107919 / 50-1 BON) TaxID=697281 RepID=F3ZWH6_MAHA5|nr:carbohydrate ABC transporter permease [Mahella australiensis]AEE95411.1 binding-protein-dependent transport systems inner membrane component [Mahella australiensis 50-1 BON]
MKMEKYSRNQYRGHWSAGRIVSQIFIILMTVIWIYPIYKMIERSFFGQGWGNYQRVLFQADSFTIAKGYNAEIADFWIYLKNSLMVTGIDMILILVCVSLAAFAFSKMDFPGNNVLYILTLIGMMMPAAGFIVPYFITLKTIGLTNNPFGLVGPHVAASIPMSMLIIRNSMDAVNDEMIESAIIDGCSKIRVFISMCIPLCKPAIGTAAIFAFMGSWNDYLLPLVLLNSPESMTITLLPQRFTAFGGGSNYGVIFASLVLISIPIFIIYLFCQRYIQSGIATGTIK